MKSPVVKYKMPHHVIPYNTLHRVLSMVVLCRGTASSLARGACAWGEGGKQASESPLCLYKADIPAHRTAENHHIYFTAAIRRHYRKFEEPYPVPEIVGGAARLISSPM